jgi:hypothetical protein
MLHLARIIPTFEIPFLTSKFADVIKDYFYIVRKTVCIQ